MKPKKTLAVLKGTLTGHTGRLPVYWFPALTSLFPQTLFNPRPLRAVRALFSLMVSGWAGGHSGGQVGSWKKFVQTVTQKL